MLVLLSVNGDLIGGIPVWGTGHFRGEHFIPGRTTGVNVLCRSQNLLCSLKFYAGQVGIDLEVVDVPVAEKITPQGHFSCVVALIFVFQSQLGQASRVIAVGHDTDNLGIAGFFIGEIFNTLTDSHGLRDPQRVRVDTVSGNLPSAPAPVIIIVIGVNLGSDPPIDGQIRHFNPAIVNLNFPQGFLWGGRSKSGGWQEPHDRKESQEHRNQSFFHERPP